jgi:hypothetical protein
VSSGALYARKRRRSCACSIPFSSRFFLAAPLAGAGGENTSEANLKLPDLGSATFLGGKGSTLLMGGLVVSALGLIFGLIIFNRLKNMAVHSSMREVSELIYETCKTYLATQGKFLMLLECFIAVIIVFYFGVSAKGEPFFKVLIILLFSVIGITGSFGVAGSACASIPSPIRAPPSPAHAAKRFPAMTSRCRPA